MQKINIQPTNGIRVQVQGWTKYELESLHIDILTMSISIKVYINR